MDTGFRPRDLGLSLRERGQVVALVDPGDHVALVDVLVVGDRNRGDIARDLGRDRELARRDEGVVGQFEMRGMVPVDVCRRPGDQERDQPRPRGADAGGGSSCAASRRLFPSRQAFPLRRACRVRLLFGRLCRALGLSRVRGRRPPGSPDARPQAASRSGGARKAIMSRLGLAEPPERGGETLSQSVSDAGASLYIFWPLSESLRAMANSPKSRPLNARETKLFRSVYFGRRRLIKGANFTPSRFGGAGWKAKERWKRTPRRNARRGVRRSFRPPAAGTCGPVEERILDAAGRVFLEHGFQGASVDEIAEAASAGKPTIYASFPNKQALFTAVVERLVRRNTSLDALSCAAGSIEQRLDALAASF